MKTTSKTEKYRNKNLNNNNNSDQSLDLSHRTDGGTKTMKAAAQTCDSSKQKKKKNLVE